MAAEIDLGVILRLMQSMQTDMRAIRTGQVEIIERLGRLERLVGDLHGDFAGQSVRMDNINARLDRVEHRLELVGPQPPAAR